MCSKVLPLNMSTLRRVLALLATALTLSLAARAGADASTATVTMPASPTHIEPSPGRAGNLNNTFITHNDCEVDDVISFSVNLGGSYAGNTLQAWAGTGCDTDTSRGQTTTASVSCWLVGQTVPTSNTVNMQIHVRDILYGKTVLATGNCTTTGTGGSGGTAGTSGTAGTDTGGTSGTGGTTDTTTCTGITTPPGYNLISGTSDEACNPSNVSSTAAASVGVFFLLVGPNTQTKVSSVASWSATYKMYAPSPPDQISTSVGDGLLIVNFKYGSGTPADPPTGYNFYCVPSNAIDGADAGSTDLNCDPVPAALAAGTLPGKEAIHCGSAAAMSERGNATGLTNFTAYRVAVSTTDAYGNAGLLSGSACQIPEPVTGFYKAYRAAGGTAGGGFCSFSNKREPIVLCLLLAIGAGLIVRRRRAA